MKILLSFVVLFGIMVCTMQAARPLQAPQLPQAPTACVCTSSADCTCSGPCPCSACEAKNTTEQLQLVVVSASWCVPCQKLRSDLLAEEVGIEGQIYTDNRKVETQYGVVSYPTILLLRDGKEVARRVGGAAVQELKDWIKQSKYNKVRSQVVIPQYHPVVMYSQGCATSA